MAGETYYFTFSILAVIGTLFFIANLIYLRLKNKTFYGQEYKPGTKEYKNVRKFASNRNILISSTIALAFVINLIYDVNRLMNLADQEYARGVFIYVPLFIFVMSVFAFMHVRKNMSKLEDAVTKKRK